MKNLASAASIILVLFISFFLMTCADVSNSFLDEPEILTENTVGEGFFKYSGYAPFANKVMNVYYYIPANTNSNTSILFVFHGTGRNAKDYRDAMISKATQYNFIVITPEFSVANFPDGDSFNLGNVFIDGDNPSASTLNPESEWTFSVIEPLFDFVKQSIHNTSEKYHIFGHSAGAQFAHRFVMFKTNARFDKVVASASGWYTVPEFTISFPYGYKDSPLETISLSNLFQKKLMIQIGDLDNDPNSSGLRHNPFADAQGLHRFDRAVYFFDEASETANSNKLQFQWQLYINKGVDHNYVIASKNAADLIFK